MDEKAITNIVKVLLAVMGLAIAAILVSSKSNTPGVFSSAGGAIKQMLCVALSPVIGGSCGTTGLTSSVNSIFTPITGGGTSGPPTYGQPGYPGCPFGMTC